MGVLVDHRYYRVKPGTMNAHLDLYEKHGFIPQTRHLGQPHAYLFTESGEINTLVHLWVYEDAADRMRKRAAMMADPEWQQFQAAGRSGPPGKPAHQSDDSGQIRSDSAVSFTRVILLNGVGHARQ
jgi:NIPSNAP